MKLPLYPVMGHCFLLVLHDFPPPPPQHEECYAIMLGLDCFRFLQSIENQLIESNKYWVGIRFLY